jgi:hypothetical protein
MISFKTKLGNKYNFWFRISDNNMNRQLNQNEYEPQIKKIAEFETVFIYIIRLKNFGLLFNI